MLKSLLFMTGCSLAVRIPGVTQARFHAPTRKAVRALNVFIVVCIPVVLVPLSVIIATGSPLYEQVLDVLVAIYVTVSVFSLCCLPVCDSALSCQVIGSLLFYFTSFVREALDGAASLCFVRFCCSP
jgi:flagellar biosynthesis component FlhA